MAAHNTSNRMSERKSETKMVDVRHLIRVRLHSTLAVPAAYITFQDTKQSAQTWKRQAVAKLNHKFQCELNFEDCVFVDGTSGIIPDHVELNGAEMRLVTLMQMRTRTSAVADRMSLIADGSSSISFTTGDGSVTVDRSSLPLPNSDSSNDPSPRSSAEISETLQPATPIQFTPSSSPLHTPRTLAPHSPNSETKADFTARLGSDFIQRLRNVEDGDALTMQAKSLAGHHNVTKGGYMTRRHGFHKKRRYCAILAGRLVVCRMKAVKFAVELILSLDGAQLKLTESREDKDMTFVLQTSDKKEYVFIAPDGDWYQQLDKLTLDRTSSFRSTRSQLNVSTLTGFEALEMEVLNWLQLHDMAVGLERQLSKVTSIVLLLLDLDGKQVGAPGSAEHLRSALVYFTPPPALQALVEWKWEVQGEEGLQILLEALHRESPKAHKLTLEEVKPLWARARMRLDPSLAVPISQMSFATAKRQSVRAWKHETVAKLNAKFQCSLDASECNLVDGNAQVLADNTELSGLELYGLTLLTLPKPKPLLRGIRTLETEVLEWLDQHDHADLAVNVAKVTSVVLLLLEMDAKTVSCEQLHFQLVTFSPPLCLKALVEWKPRDVEVVEREEVKALLEVLNLDASRKLTYEEFKPLLSQLTQSKQDDLVRVRLDESLGVPIAYITCSMKKTQSAKAWKYDIILKLNSKCSTDFDPADCLFVNSNNKPLEDELELSSVDLKALTLTRKPEFLDEVDLKTTTSTLFRLAPKDSAQLAQASRNDIQTLLHKLSSGAWNRLIFYGLDPIVQIEALSHPLMPDCDPFTRQAVSLHDLLMFLVSSLPGSQKMAQLAEDLQHIDPIIPQPIREIELLLDLFFNLQDVELKCRCDYSDIDRKSIPAGTNDCLLLIMHSFLSIGGMDCLLENVLTWTGMTIYDAAFEWVIKIVWLLDMTQAKQISCAGAIELDLFPDDDCWWQENALSKCVGLIEDPPLSVFVALFEIANDRLETLRDRKPGYEALVRIQSFRNVRMFNVMELGWKNARFSVLEHSLEYVVCCQSQKKNIRYLLSDPLWYRYFIPLLLNGGSQSSFNINARTLNSAEAEAKVETVLKLAVSACVTVLHGAYLGLGVETPTTPASPDNKTENKPEEVGSKSVFSTLVLSFFDGVEEIALWTPDTVMIIRLVLQALLTKVSHSLAAFCHDPSSQTWDYFFQLCSVVENFVFYSPTMDSPLRSIEDRRFTHLGLHGDDDVILVELLLECIAGLKIDSLFIKGFDPLINKLCSKITQRVLEEQEFWKSSIEFLRLVGSLDQKTLEKTKSYKTCEAALKQRRSRSKIVKKHATLEAKRIRRALRAPTSAARKAKDLESPNHASPKPAKHSTEQAFWKLHSEALASAQAAREQRAQQFLNKTLLSRSRPFPKPHEIGSKVLLTERRVPTIRRTTVITPSQEELKLEKEILRVRSVRRNSFDGDDETESTWQRGMSILENRPRGSFSLARRNSASGLLDGTKRFSILRRNSSTEVARMLELRVRSNSFSRRHSGSETPRLAVEESFARRASKSATPGSPQLNTILNSVRKSISFPPDGPTFPFASLFKSEPVSASSSSSCSSSSFSSSSSFPSSSHTVSVSLASASDSTVTSCMTSSPHLSSSSTGKFSSIPPISSSPSSSPPPSPVSTTAPDIEPASEPSTPTTTETPTFFPPAMTPRSLSALTLPPSRKAPSRPRTFFNELDENESNALT